ncbi:MAG TPA: hypothetical protein VIQ78_06775 [Terrimesophilobacter sp.]|jgi:hypothetical protein|uniref:hypothetical protein n=1 Tax=Terrimesophilobacter sp. TaxID=2906435 RepID=UPI002F94A668
MHKSVVAVCAGALALALSLVGAAPVIALPADPADAHILVFANAGVNDTSASGEVDRTITALQELGGTVTTFDGGDGSDTAWTAALVGIDVLSLPEPERGSLYVAGGTPFMSVAAATVVKNWVSAGGQVVANATFGAGSSYEPLLSFLTGLDYSTVFQPTVEFGLVWELQDDRILGAPAALTWVDGTYSFQNYGTWDAALKAGVTPIYLSADQQSMAVGSFSVGSGAFVFLAYDWYSDPVAAPDEIADWVTVLQLATQAFPTEAPVVVVPPAPQPELAEAGADGTHLAVGGGVLLLLGVSLLFLRRRALAA